jgi:hypothetical protein
MDAREDEAVAEEGRRRRLGRMQDSAKEEAGTRCWHGRKGDAGQRRARGWEALEGVPGGVGRGQRGAERLEKRESKVEQRARRLPAVDSGGSRAEGSSGERTACVAALVVRRAEQRGRGDGVGLGRDEREWERWEGLDRVWKRSGGWRLQNSQEEVRLGLGFSRGSLGGLAGPPAGWGLGPFPGLAGWEGLSPLLFYFIY